ncbi:GDSL-type esterase/lipase family protein [Lentisphaera marina]|uniref:SGNH/GDSL hydrolase family protein n=1 Tax=Lentisphaera marina TaxID=1111041 RepID=UPI00236600F3|nr:GDSL-type esterase/lipase family protein [Lentisphaera marina]MDD7985064.1 GDSL-type esterase/lipase family protein [Lentisphaera marina]
MQLSSLIPHIHGCLHVDQNEQGLQPHRLTHKQLKHFAKNETWDIRARCPAGIRIELITDSPYLDLGVYCGDYCRSWLALDVVIDGALQATVRVDGPPKHWNGRLQLAGEGDRHILVLLPYTVTCRISSWGLADGATCRPAPKAKGQILNIGDSIIQGMTGSGMGSSCAWRLSQLLKMDMLNQGVGGHIFEAASWDPDITVNPSLITCTYGNNDFNTGRTHEDVFKDARDHMEAVRATFPDVPIVLVSPIWRSFEDKKDYAKFVDFGSKLRQSFIGFPGMTVIDGQKMVSHREDRYEDGVHPNDVGFAEFAINLYKEIKSKVDLS